MSFFFLSLVLFVSCALAVDDEVGMQDQKLLKEAQTNENGADSGASKTNSAGEGCSSSPYEKNPCGIESQPGFFSWVEDAREYSMIYQGICLAMGICIFILVISAAIIVGKKVGAMKAAEARVCSIIFCFEIYTFFFHFSLENPRSR